MATEPKVVNPLRERIASPAKSLPAKLAQIMGEMRNVPKSGFNQAQKYAFVRESDVAERVSELLSAAGIWINQTVLSHTREPLYTTQSGLQMWLTTVEVEYQFVDGDTGEVTPARMYPGTGADTGDKGLYKALTGSEKYFLMKSFLVSTGDDPEADEKVDKAAAAASAGSSGVRISRGAQTGVQRGGRSSQATTAQITEIAKLARNAGLDAEAVVVIAERIVGGPKKADEVSIRDWLSGLTGEQAAEIVAALSTVEPPKPEVSTEPSTSVDDSEEPPAVSIV